jgi:molybdopterin biosynthesis enzyme
MRDIYLESTPLRAALRKWLEKLELEGVSKPLPGEAVRVMDSLSRITAEAVIAKIPSLFYHSSAVDGFAVKFPETFGGSDRNILTLK